MSVRRLTVLLHGNKVAEIERLPEPSDRFTLPGFKLTITSQTQTPLSLSFIGSDPEPPEARAWMEGLLPSDPTTRNAWARHYRVDEGCPFSLLATEIGSECAGAVQFVPEGQEEQLASRPSGIRSLTDAQVAAWLRYASTPDSRQARHGGNARPYPLRTLSGMQPKIGLRRTEQGWQEPYGNASSTHIVKLPPSGHDNDSVLEALCQTAARNLGLAAAKCEVVHIDDLEVVVYTRFDREHTPTGGVRRLHHEHVNQAIGGWHRRKFQSQGGPDLDRVVELLQKHSRAPDQEVGRFLDAVFYQHLIGSTDGHAEAFSLRLESGEIALAPLYDMSSSLLDAPSCAEPARGLYPAMWPRVADAPTGAQPTLHELDQPEAWAEFAGRNDLDLEALLERKRELATRLPDAFDAASSRLPQACRERTDVQSMLSRVRQRAARCSSI